MSKGWTEERRKAQAERCRANKPWKNSTGPKSEDGKARSSMNAYKNGGQEAAMKLLKEALFHNAEFLRLVQTLHENELIKMQCFQRPYPPTPKTTGKTK